MISPTEKILRYRRDIATWLAIMPETPDMLILHNYILTTRIYLCKRV